MKKLAAILAMCLVMTSALVSCGDADESSSGSSAKASTSTSASEENSSDEASTEEASDDETDTTKASDDNNDETSSEASSNGASEASSEDDTTKASKELPTGGIIPTEEDTTKTTVDPSTLKGGNIVGSWEMTEEEVTMILTFKDDKTVGEAIDFSGYISFEGNKMKFGDGEYAQELDLEFDGTKGKVTVSGEEYLTLERISGETDKNNMDGTYKISGGIMSSMLGGGDKDITLKIDGKKVLVSTDNFGKYEINGNKLKLTENGDNETEEVSFSVDGDTLTVVDENGEATVLKKVD